MFQPMSKDSSDSIPRFADFRSYPNNRSNHQLKLYKNGLGLCSCGQFAAEGFSEASVIRTHQYHVFNTNREVTQK